MSFDQGYWVTPAHVLGAGIGLSILDITFVTFKFLGRKTQKQPLQADDWLLIPATLLTVGIGILMIYGVAKKGLAYPLELPPGAHENPLLVSTEQTTIEGKLLWIHALFLPLALGCTKASFLCFYRRIFAVNRSSKTNLFLTGMCIFVGLWSIGFFFTTLFECGVHTSAFWSTPLDVMEHCLSDSPKSFTFTLTDFATDLAMCFIPIPLVWRLNLSVAQKVAVIGIFSLGGLTMAASLARFVMTAKILAFGFDPNSDSILLVTACIYWGMVETGIAIFAACLPSLWVFSKGTARQSLVRHVRSIASSSMSGLRGTRPIKDNTHTEKSLESGNRKDFSSSSSNTSKSWSATAPRIQSFNIDSTLEVYGFRQVG